MKRRVGELGRRRKYGLQDGGRRIGVIIAKNDTGVVFVSKTKKTYMLYNVKHFCCVFRACKSCFLIC